MLGWIKRPSLLRSWGGNSRFCKDDLVTELLPGEELPMTLLLCALSSSPPCSGGHNTSPSEYVLPGLWDIAGPSFSGRPEGALG